LNTSLYYSIRKMLQRRVYTALQPTAVRRGIGSMLLQLGITHARRLEPGAVTVLALLNAQTFYERYGFTKVGESEVFRGKQQLPIKVVRMQLS
jgi:ribosomal protein S18 acetylase RimI-like enzyme